MNPVAERLQHEFGVLISPGRFFGKGCENYFRIGFGGSSTDVREGLDRLTHGIQAMA